jgi:beta-galactosidase
MGLPSRRQILQAASAILGRAILPAAKAAGPGQPAPIRLANGWEFHEGTLGGVWEVWRGKAAAANVSWTRVSLPHCFNAWDAVDPDREYYQGPGWYRTAVPVANPYRNGRTLLHFEAAGQRSEVFVGLESIGQHAGGYDEFVFDVTEAAARQTGPVQLAVLCDNSRDLETIPSDQADFVRYGGLYRSVHLVYVPVISVERVHVETTASRQEAMVSVRARLWNPAGLRDSVRIGIEIAGPSGETVATSSEALAPWDGARQVAAFQLPAPTLWSPRTPHLYRASVTLEGPHGRHTAEERFGLRYFEFPEHGTFHLNGEKLFLRGTSRHEDHAGVGAAMSDDLIGKELRLIKEMGANFIRLGHYQQSRLVLDLCDELGLVVWEEIPWCRGGVGHDRYREQARRMLRNLIDQHRNHPSIVFWGLGNENDWPGDFETFDEQAVRGLMAELQAIAHQADPSRLTAIRRCPFAADIPDVYAPSIWTGWYSGRYTEYQSALEQEAQKVRRMLHIEWGGDSHPGRHSEEMDRGIAGATLTQASKDGDWSETYICNLFDWHLQEQEAMDWLAGAAQWVFKDFATPQRPENPVPRINQKGLVERDLTPKEGYYVFQSYWAERPMAHIYGHTWPIRWGDPGESKLVKVYSNCPAVELFLNGESCGTKQRRSRDFPAAGLRWLLRFQPGENHLLAVARKGNVEVRDELRFRYQTAKWGQPARLELEELGRWDEIVTIQARLLDAAGVPCLYARNVVRFAAAGDGELIENLGTASGSRKVEMANGRALARIRWKPGTTVLSVSAEGLPTAILKLG